jgi:hypothetical protein
MTQIKLVEPYRNCVGSIRRPVMKFGALECRRNDLVDSWLEITLTYSVLACDVYVPDSESVCAIFTSQCCLAPRISLSQH